MPPKHGPLRTVVDGDVAFIEVFSRPSSLHGELTRLAATLGPGATATVRVGDPAVRDAAIAACRRAADLVETVATVDDGDGSLVVLRFR